MTKQLLFLLLLLGSISIYGQESPSKWSAHLSIGQYPATLVAPNFSPIHPGINAGFTYQWNNNAKHRIIQSGNLAYFYHRDFQKALQLFTEIGYQLKLNNGLAITPFAIGGGYVLSIADLKTLDWNEDTKTYTLNKFPVRNNWLISLGFSLGYETPINIASRPVTFFLDYRLQIQGIIVQENIPVIAYAPIRIGISMPLQKNIED